MSVYELEGTVSTRDWTLKVRQPLTGPDEYEGARERWRNALGDHLTSDSLALIFNLDVGSWPHWDFELTLYPNREEAEYVRVGQPPADDSRLVEYDHALYRDGRLMGYVDCVEYERADHWLVPSGSVAFATAPQLCEVILTPAFGPAPGR